MRTKLGHCNQLLLLLLLLPSISATTKYKLQIFANTVVRFSALLLVYEESDNGVYCSRVPFKGAIKP